MIAIECLQDTCSIRTATASIDICALPQTLDGNAAQSIACTEDA
jgi:hypothetical protein